MLDKVKSSSHAYILIFMLIGRSLVGMNRFEGRKWRSYLALVQLST